MSVFLENILQIVNNERISLTALERKIGASKGVLSRATEKSTDIGVKWLVAIVENYPQYSADWLLTGKGPMHKVEETVKPEQVEGVWMQKGDKKQITQRVPLYAITATAGIVDLLAQNAQKHMPIDYITIPNLPKCDGALRITGDSMYPLLKSGDIALYKEVHDKSNIIWGEMYLIALTYKGDDFFFAKYVQKAEREGWVNLVSQNKHHQDKEFPLDSITAIALIKATIRINTGF